MDRVGLFAASLVPEILANLFAHRFKSTDCTGRTIIVTGANVGLGKEAARHYVRLNAEKVILACRSLDKGEAAKKDIEATTGRKGAIEVWQLDLGSYQSVKQFAERAKTLRRLDSIVENAGISTTNYKAVEDNESTSKLRFDLRRRTVCTDYRTVTVNVVSTFLLALLILPKLQETGRQFNVTPNLTIVSSEVHFLTAVSSSHLNISLSITDTNDSVVPRTQILLHLRNSQ